MPPLDVDVLVGVGTGLALAAAAGFRVFVPLLVVSFAARTGWLPLSTGFEWMGTTPALVVFATATVLEIAAYYFPFFDNLLDTIATPAAVLAGIVASASVLTDLPPWLRYSVAIIGAGGTAGIVQGSTVLLRLKSSAATAGTGNVFLASLELLGALIMSVASLLLPLLALLLVAGFLFFAMWRLARLRHRRVSAIGPRL
jgi:Domain of unknown function (DUF4126)